MTLRCTRVFLIPVLVPLGLLLAVAVAIWTPPAHACGAKKHAVRGHAAEPVPPSSVDSRALSNVSCVDGWADIYACDRVDLLAVLPRGELGTDPAVATGSDLWGWVDSESGIEYALMGLADGTAFVSLENPSSPRFLGKLPTRTVTVPWRDIKVYRDHAFIVADGAGHGMQVFDLRQLRSIANAPVTFTPTAVYRGPGLSVNGGFQLGNSHNLALNEETGFAYAVGSNTCNSGLHMIDVREPSRPRFAGCFGETGYTHDTQCVVYRGPDSDHQGKEICFNSDPNPSSLSIVDVSDKSRPTLISRNVFPGGAFSHQGWLSEDQSFFLLGDELDEVSFGHPTRTLVFDLRNLDAPTIAGRHDAITLSIGHNMYTRGSLLYQANYTSGVRILRQDDLSRGRLEEVAFFDLFPPTDGPMFRGNWTVYPYLPSGNLIASSIDGGLFVLRPRLGAAGSQRPLGNFRPERPTRLRINLGASSATLTWNDAADNEEGYRIYRSIDRGPLELVATLPAGSEAYEDGLAGDPGDRVYEFRVAAFNDEGESDRSRVSVITPLREIIRHEGPRRLDLQE